MPSGVVVGLDNGGTTNNATVLTADGRFLIGGMAETPSRVKEGPDVAVGALVQAFDEVLEVASLTRAAVQAVGLDSPGPASPTGVMCSTGSTNFQHPSWQGFDIRGALEEQLEIPVVYNNDANAAAYYAHRMHFAEAADRHGSVAVIVGTGLGGGIVDRSEVLTGAAGMAGELGHMPLPTADLLQDDQPVPACNCGREGDAESFASLTAIGKNLLPYWLTKFPGHPLGELEIEQAAFALRQYAEKHDPLALAVFEQQAKAIAMLFTMASSFIDPHAYFVGGGVVQAEAAFRNWFLATIEQNVRLRPEQRAIVRFGVVPDLDLAGARGAALLALRALSTGPIRSPLGVGVHSGCAVAETPRPCLP